MSRARRTTGIVAALVAVVAALATVPSASSSAAGSCTGFRNRTGVTSTTITLANVSDLSGPVPGVGRPALDGAKAFAAYFNASSSTICGRKLKVLSLDSKTDTSSGGSAYVTACSHALAAVGSWSLFDAGGATTARNCNLPDLRSISFSPGRNACTTCFGVQATEANAFPNAIPDYFLANTPTASQSAAILYLNLGPYAARAKTMQADERHRGMHFNYSAGIDVAEFNYAPYVSQLKGHGVRLVQFVGPYQQAVRLAQAMHDASYAPRFQPDSSTYFNSKFVSTGGAAVDGAFIPMNVMPFSDPDASVELRRYLIWLQKVDRGATPSVDGLFAWSAARLFADRAQALGGRLSRTNLITSVRGVHAWTDHGAHASQDVGSKLVGTCWRMMRLTSGTWTQAGGGTGYTCHGKTVVTP